MYDLIIIGSGPAGLSAAVYGKRAGLNLLIIEEKPMSGGQMERIVASLVPGESAESVIASLRQE